jgi:hypothetical protein
MTSTTSGRFTIDPMWRYYAAAWLTHALVITAMLQAKDLAEGRFDLMDALQAAQITLSPALMLAPVWPLAGWLERRGARLAAAIGLHVLAALVFAVCSLFLIKMMMGPYTKPLAWYLWPFMYFIMMYGLVAGVFHLVRTSRAAHRQALAIHQAQSLLIASELSALRSKLNPHFLFNTLHSIIALTRKDSGAAEAALFHFSDMLRYVLDTEKRGHDRVTLEEELRFVRDYLDLEALRLGERLSIEWDVDDAAAGQPLPALTLQPLVENSIKHAFNPHSRPGRLLIRTRVEHNAGRLLMTVRDDGPGADRAQIDASTGLGIRTVARRLQLDYGARAEFDIDTAPGAGFEVRLSIPLEAA